MSKLAADLDTALQLWRVRWRAGERDRDKPRRVTVAVTHTGDVAPLVAAGLEVSFAEAGQAAGLIAFRDVERLAAVPTVAYIEKEPDSHPLLDKTVKEIGVPWKVPPTTPWPGRGAGVIVAVIDTGIDIFHDSFKKADGSTRILELWDQAATTGGSAPPSGVPAIGRVYSKADIQAGLNAGPPFHSIDKNGHGTHVAGTAAGNGRQDDRCSSPGRYVGVAPEADLVIVKAIDLPTGSDHDTRAAMRWCAAAPARLGTPNKPVVINCSFGSSTGPHDGTAYNDRSVDLVLRPPTGEITEDPPPGLAIVCAAGNNGESEIHERGTVPANGSASVSFYIPHGSSEDDTLDIWYNGTASLELKLTAPPNPEQPGPDTITIKPGDTGPFTIGGMFIAASSPTPPLTMHNNKKQINVTISVKATTELDGAITSGATSIKVTSAAGFPTQGNFKIRIGAEVFTVTAGQGTTTWTVTRGVDTTTAAAHSNHARVVHLADLVVRPGVWTLELEEKANVAANWRAWFASSNDDAYPTFRLPKTAAVERRREDTVGNPGSSVNSITVANYSADNGLIAPSSSRGVSPLPAGSLGPPTIAAPGTGVTAPRSRDYAIKPSSCCDQLITDMTGTSMAAPHVAGLIALMLQKNKMLTFVDLRKHLRDTARSDGIPAAEAPPSHIWGAGKVNAAAALTAVPAEAGGGGGGGGGGDPGAPMLFAINESEFGYTPHTIFSRLGEWRTRFGPRPGLMLVAALISEHFDEILRLVNQNPKVGTVWRRHGGPVLVRQLLYGPRVETTLLPAVIDGCDVRSLIRRFLPILKRFGSPRLLAGIDRYQEFVQTWPGATLHRLDQRAAELAVQR